MSEIIDAFVAFNVNGINSLLYMLSKNLWFVLIAISAVVTTVAFLKAEIEVTVHEEQQIL